MRSAYSLLSPAEKDAHRERSRRSASKWYHSSAANRQKVAAYRKQWRAENREWANFLGGLRRYGITLDQYHAMNERQDFVCAICKEDKTLVIDHCHTSGKVRGLLCVSCNTGIGSLRESVAVMENAMKYLGRAA